MSDYLYEGLSVAVKVNGDYAQYGVIIHGRFFPFAGRKIGGFQADVAEAQHAEAEAEQQQPQQPQ